MNLLGMYWWALLVKGISAVVFGLFAIFWPGPTLIALVYIFSAYILIAGIMDITLGIYSRNRSNFWLFGLILGVLEVGVGVYAIRHPQVTLAAFILLVGFTFLFRGVLQIVAAFLEETPDRASKFLLALVGGLSVLAGIYILLQPAAGSLAFVWALGVYALIVGPMEIARAAEVRVLFEQHRTRLAT
ncbi:MAG TPA: DUF308 domain-containing protein [Candidatus Saccharimonadia bacterium]